MPLVPSGLLLVSFAVRSIASITTTPRRPQGDGGYQAGRSPLTQLPPSCRRVAPGPGVRGQGAPICYLHIAVGLEYSST